MTAVASEEEMGGPGYEPAIRYNFICFVFEVSAFQKCFSCLRRKSLKTVLLNHLYTSSH